MMWSMRMRVERIQFGKWSLRFEQNVYLEATWLAVGLELECKIMIGIYIWSSVEDGNIYIRCSVWYGHGLCRSAMMVVKNCALSTLNM